MWKNRNSQINFIQIICVDLELNEIHATKLIFVDPPEVYMYSWKEGNSWNKVHCLSTYLYDSEIHVRRHARNVTVTRRGIVCTRDILRRQRDLKSIGCDLEGRLILHRDTTRFPIKTAVVHRNT